MLDTHACFISFIVLPDRPLQSTLESRSQSTPEAATTTSRPPETRTRISVRGSQAGGLAFSIVVDICASLLKACFCSCVCTQILLLPLTLCSRADIYSSPRGPWLVLNSLCYFILLVLCCDIYRDTLISIMYPACMITVHDRNSGALQNPSGFDNLLIFFEENLLLPTSPPSASGS